MNQIIERRGGDVIAQPMQAMNEQRHDAQARSTIDWADQVILGVVEIEVAKTRFTRVERPRHSDTTFVIFWRRTTSGSLRHDAERHQPLEPVGQMNSRHVFELDEVAKAGHEWPQISPPRRRQAKIADSLDG